jgi:hypothetical protein
MNKSIIQIMGVYSAVLALVFGLTGLLEAATGLELMDEVEGISVDLFGGLSLIVISLVYIKGVTPLLMAKSEGLSYLFVGAIITFAISGLYISMLSATWFGETIVAGFEPQEGGTEMVEDADSVEDMAVEAADVAEEEPWSPLDEVRLEMLYLFLALPGYFVAKRCGKC